MAKRWEPTSQVGDKEPVGRRIFDDPIFRGDLNEGARGKLRIDHFEENREDGEISLDRLGRTNSETRVLRYLVSRCDHAGTKFLNNKRFEGWAALQVQKIRGQTKLVLDVKASPILTDSAADDDVESNIYHSHISIPKDLGQHPEYFVALHLKHLFDRFGNLVQRPVSPTKNRPSQKPKNNGAD